MTSGDAEIGRVGTWGVILRAMFLACSWTWCIGMFFPVFFVGDFGVWGWVAFAVPNVIGAGAMGWVLRRRGASEEIVAGHLPAMRCFSIVTVMFQISFAMWFFQLHFPQFSQRQILGGYLLVLLFNASVGFARMPRKWWNLVTAGSYLVSLAAAVGAALTTDTLQLPSEAGKHGLGELLMASPVLVFGFALCPYLDLTFHRVRRETPGGAGVWAFWLGFVGFFLPMIVFTLFYAGGLLEGKSLSLFVAVHVGLQLAFTIGAHFRELIETQQNEESEADTAIGQAWLWVRPFIWPFVGIWVALASTFLANAPDIRPGYPAHRLVYELFMSFYALVFPAYVWIVVIERNLPRPTRLALYLSALALASPCLWLGYIEQRYVWLLPGVAIPLVLPFLGQLLRPSTASRR